MELEQHFGRWKAGTLQMVDLSILEALKGGEAHPVCAHLERSTEGTETLKMKEIQGGLNAP